MKHTLSPPGTYQPGEPGHPFQLSRSEFVPPGPSQRDLHDVLVVAAEHYVFSVEFTPVLLIPGVEPASSSLLWDEHGAIRHISSKFPDNVFRNRGLFFLSTSQEFHPPFESYLLYAIRRLLVLGFLMEARRVIANPFWSTGLESIK